MPGLIRKRSLKLDNEFIRIQIREMVILKERIDTL